MPTCVINRRLDAQLVFSRSRPSATEKKKSRRGRAAWLNQRLRSPGRRRHFRAAPHRRATLDMGKGGDASANGPKVSSKGLNPDRQYTQIRGQVRAPRASRLPASPQIRGTRARRSFAARRAYFKMARAGRAADDRPTPERLLPVPPAPSQVYDITDFAKSHPGGSQLLALAVGRDATILFESHHVRPEIVAKTLKTLPKVDTDVNLCPTRTSRSPWTLPSTAASSSACATRSWRRWRRCAAASPRAAADASWTPRASSPSSSRRSRGTCTPSILTGCVLGMAGYWSGTGLQHTANHGGLCQSSWWNQAWVGSGATSSSAKPRSSGGTTTW